MGIYTETHPCHGCDKPVYGDSYEMCPDCLHRKSAYLISGSMTATSVSEKEPWDAIERGELKRGQLIKKVKQLQKSLFIYKLAGFALSVLLIIANFRVIVDYFKR